MLYNSDMKSWMTEIPEFSPRHYPQKAGRDMKAFIPPPWNTSPQKMSIPEKMPSGACYAFMHICFCSNWQWWLNPKRAVRVAAYCLWVAVVAEPPCWQANHQTAAWQALLKWHRAMLVFILCFHESVNTAKLKYNTDFQFCTQSTAEMLLMFVKMLLGCGLNGALSKPRWFSGFLTPQWICLLTGKLQSI